MTIPLRLASVLPLLGALALSGCASGGAAQPSGSAAEGTGDGLKVMASFYPLQYVAERVGGPLVEVESLTPPGAEPHDLELSPAAVAELEQAAAVVYLSGFQPAVDDAVAQASPEHVVDVSAEADLEAGHSEEEHAGESAEEHAEHEGGQGGKDLHFWLDPERLAHAGQAVAREFGEADPANAAVYEENAAALARELTALDAEFAKGLATCELRTVVVSHEAYGYLTEKYGLEQVGIAGLEPDTEPSPARLAEIGKVVRDEGVTTVFTETLVNPKVAETLASDLDIRTAVLDPLEGLADDSSDYQQVMRANLEALRSALRCG
ncbi:metal ABC transporter substrate-binding protein [Arthrobacter mobilis]|uniref:Zinc ABC transporter substrate-binding protein n=1 Tax=Arthrobacter mobilis TaxID=2724944 RepID=A0A7X6HC75_9MICC|nr:metal ABC transporter substrate-binding protein [Arthrobacter mobilis]NKX54433.1 zinc ABC transporter substrate-binding protein [Arthrobacter mobilis]